MNSVVIYIVLFYSFCGYLGLFLQGVHGQYWLESEVQVKEKEYGQVYASAFFYVVGPTAAMIFCLSYAERMVHRYEPGYLNKQIGWGVKGVMVVLAITYFLLAVLLAKFMERLRWCADVLPATDDTGASACNETMFLRFLDR